ncbi:ATP-dependent RNA helicase DDX39A-like [Amphiura filiformis]|uniref:ATP-dependent RNA helicase DDX39A-like n=1 Tax=Amphiura filiformis TaxID=82378 RepID=UPI003B20CA62
MIIICNNKKQARNIGQNYRSFSTNMFESPIKVAVFRHGSMFDENRRVLKYECPHIVVGSLQRVTDLVREKSLRLNDIKVFAVFVCDFMLGTRRFVAYQDLRGKLDMVFQKAAHEKQVLLFSAPMHDKIRPLCRQFFKSQEFAYINCNASDHHGVLHRARHSSKHYYINLREYEKEEHLLDCMEFLKSKRVLIIVGEAWKCKAVALTCGDNTLFYAHVIYWGMSREEKQRTCTKFQHLDKGILVVTKFRKLGVGLAKMRFDIVIHYDFPAKDNLYQFENMISKAGRKPGQNGMTVTFVLDDEVERFRSMQERLDVAITELNRDTDLSTVW